jgi:hypothetical protein
MDRTCGECGAGAARLRKGRCDACYMRQYRRPAVEAGARCAGCGERRRPLLDSLRLGAETAVLCGNCALVLTRARPRVETVADLRDRLAPAHVPERRTGRRARPALAPVVPSFDPSID